MKTTALRFYRPLLVLFLALIAYHSSRGQTIAKPTVFTNLASGPQSITGASISGTESWFRWPCGDGITKLEAKITEQGKFYQSSAAELYLSVSTDSIHKISVDSLNSDSTLYLAAGYLTATDTIFIRFVNINGVCGTCTYSNPLVDFTIYSTLNSCAADTLCSLVRNGGFEQSAGVGCGVNVPTGTDCWFLYENTSDIFRRYCNAGGGQFNLGANTWGSNPTINSHNPFSNNDAVAGFFCETNILISNHYYTESIQSPLISPLIPGHTYQLSFWAYNFQGDMGTRTVNGRGYPSWVAFATNPAFSISPAPNPGLTCSFPNGLNIIQNILVSSINSWSYHTQTFTYSGPAGAYLLVGPDVYKNFAWGYNNRSDNPFQYIVLDDINIIETTPLTTPSTTICAGQTGSLTASGMNTYVWQPGYTTGSTTPVNPIVTTIYTVTGTYAAGAGCTLVNTATVTVDPLPNITLVTPSVGICPGGSVTLAANGGTSYTWSPCPANNTNCNTNALVVNPSVATTYTVTGLASGCTNTAVASVYILDPTNSIQVSGYTTICQGESAYLSATGATNYTWSPCTSGCNSATLAPTPSVTTTYTVRGINACGVLSTSTVVVNVKQTWPVDPAVLSNPICSGNSVPVIANGGSPYSYTWTPGNTVGTMISVTPSVTTTYTACTSVPGCSTTCAAVTVTVLPVPQLTITPASFTVCAGTPTTLVASGAVTYTWMPCSSACNTNPFSVTSYTDPSTYTVTGTAVNGCTNSAQSVATVITPTNALTVSPSQTICIGNSITLTASGSSGYTWTPCASGCNSSTISVSPTVTTTYTVSGLNNCGNVITKTVQVVVTPPYVITATAQPDNICAGSSTTLTATSANHVNYFWYPNYASGSPIVESPTVTTTYTVQSIVPNCGLSQAVVTVTVNPVPLSANLNPSSNFVCAGTNATLSANVSPAGTYTYNWQPSGAQSVSSTYTFTPTDNEVYVFSVSNACGSVMSNSVCIDVVNNECCLSIENMAANISIGSSGTYSTMDGTTQSPKWRVNGPVTITGNVTWRNIDYHMMQGAKITILAGAKLTLENCRLFSCTDLWEGIILQAGGAPATPKIEVINSTIEDAYRAIYYDAQNVAWDDNIVTSGTTFNKNYIGIDVANTPATPVSAAVAVALADNFTGAASLTSPGSKLKCSSFYSPTLKAIPFAGVYFDNQNCDLHLGDAGFNAANTNTYDNLNYGIYLNNAMTRVFKSTFNNLKGWGLVSWPFPPPIGIGVYAINSYPSANHSVHVEQCSFAKVYRGVHAEDINLYSVLYNQFNAPFTDANYTGNAAVYANNTVDRGWVQNNGISNFVTGVYHGYSAPVAATGFSLSVFQNTINAVGTATAYCNQAITLNDAINTFSTTGRSLHISTNRITTVKNGITVNNVRSGLRISNNTLSIQYSASGNAAGIRMTGSQETSVDNNTINSTGTGNVNLRGVYLQLSPSCYVRCNTVSNVGQGFVIEGNCLTARNGFINNTVNNAYDGLVLKTNGVLGEQGLASGILNLRFSAGNKWLGTFGNSKTLVTDVGSSALNSKFNILNNANELPAPQALNKAIGNAFFGFDNFGTSAFNTNPTLIVITSANQTCPAPNTTGYRQASADTTGEAYLKAQADSALFNLLAGPGTNAVIETETRELSRKYVFDLLDNGYTTNHSGLNAFYTQQSDSALSVYSEVDSLLLSGAYSAAQQQNGISVSNTLIQQNQQFINEALLKQATGNGGFSATEMADLTQLANQCPLVYGTAVYQARALLCALAKDQLTFNENCEVDSKGRKAGSSGTDEAEQISLFPNPNQGAMTLRYSIRNNASLRIYDISGRVLYQSTLDKERTSLHLQTSLAEGIYIYSIVNEQGRVLNTDKLVVIH